MFYNIPADYDYAEGTHLFKTRSENDFDQKPVGMGVIKLKEIIETAKECGTEYFIVEMDYSDEMPRMEAARRSLENIKKIL